jgi:hypothetical protein
MNDLRELIGQTVTATIAEDEKGNYIDVRCEIVDLQIDDYFFEQKGEAIYITVNAAPIGKLPKGFTYADLAEIPLCNIRK